MISLINNNAKQPYTYTRYTVEELTDDVITELLMINRVDAGHKSKSRGTSYVNRMLKKYPVSRGKYGKSYIDIQMSFDIETSTIGELATMYIWQIGFNNNVIIGRTWEQLTDFIERLKNIITPTQQQRVLCFVHNLGFEWSFIHSWFDFSNADNNFFKEERKPLFVTADGWLEFRDSMALSGGSLDRLAKDYTNTQKCVGDLNYSVERSNVDNLDDTELQYVDNDVLILTEFSRYFFDTFLVNKFNPLTKTAILNKDVTDEFARLNVKNRYNATVEQNHPKRQHYEYIMNRLFTGGYTHALNEIVGETLTERDRIKAYDLTSSYPSIMLLEKMPYNFKKKKPENFEKYKDSGHPYYGTFKITNMIAKYNHSIFSTSKCIATDNAIVDNGRVLKGSICIMLTDLDVKILDMFYTYDEITAINLYVGVYGYMYPWLVNAIISPYIQKEILKSSGQPYAMEKSKVNSGYGLTVKRIHDERVIYSGEFVAEKLDEEAWQRQMDKNVLSPFHGIWVTAWGRFNLLSTVAKIEQTGHRVIYCDTDSIKILNADESTQKIINDYNDTKKKQLAYVLKMGRYNITDTDAEHLKGIGEWDEEYSDGIVAFKTLGSKRYLITYKDGEKIKHNQTIAGLPKNYLFNNCDDWKQVYENFTNKMIVKNCKLTTKYTDEPYTLTVNGVEHYEKSGVALVPIDFSMSLDDLWLTVLYELFKKGKI